MNNTFTNMGTPENNGGVLKDIVEKINVEGIPSTGEMRAVVEQQRQEDFSSNLKQDIQNNLTEYTMLFEKFKSGSASGEEMKRMGEVMSHLEELQKNLGINT